jgi:hypothetical protein
LNPSKGTLSREGAKHSSAEVAKRLYLNGIDISPLTPGLLNQYNNPTLLNNVLGEIMLTFDNQALPAHVLDHIISKKYRERAWILCTNPFNGVIKPGMPGYENYTTIWGDFSEETLHTCMKGFRLKSLMDKANEIGRSNLQAPGLSLTTESQEIDPLGGDMELNSAPQYAQEKSQDYLFQLLGETMASVLYSDTSQQELGCAGALYEVEYLHDPGNPFRDSKDLRNTQASLLAEKVYTFLKAGNDVGDLLGGPDINYLLF